MQKKIYIIAGHSKPTPGATAYNNKSEHTYTTELQQLVADNIKNSECLNGTSMNPITEKEFMSNYDVRQMINTYATSDSIGIDIHFNDNNPKATGTEVIVSEKTSMENMERAARIGNKVAKCLGIPLRKRVPQRDYIYPSETFVGKLAILDNTKIPMILLEVCFLNEKDLPKYESNKHKVAEIIAKELMK
jgi:N-acetylmuramoyl-L-alanine amidase